jgi:hypothetical protein
MREKDLVKLEATLQVAQLRGEPEAKKLVEQLGGEPARSVPVGGDERPLRGEAEAEMLVMQLGGEATEAIQAAHIRGHKRPGPRRSEETRSRCQIVLIR